MSLLRSYWKWPAAIAAVILLLGLAAWLNRDAILLHLVRAAAERDYPIEAHRPVAWSGAPHGALRAPRADGPPNIILIVADDLGWNDLTINGGVAGGAVPTPNMDRIAFEGAFFENGYAAFGTCAPSRASLMSGRYSTRFGFEFTPTPQNMLSLLARLHEHAPNEPEHYEYFGEVEQIPYEDMGMPASEVTLAETLSDAGYYTAHIGKWHLGRSEGMLPHEQGFADSLLMHSGLYLPVDSPEVVNSRQDFDPIDRFLWAGMRYAASFNGGEAFEPRGYITDYYTEEAVSVIAQNRHRPFFLYLAHWAPHTPLQATREDYEALAHIEDHRLRVYAAMIRALDRGVGEVLDALDANGLDENTLVIFTSDNGGAGYVGLPDINAPYRGWKITFFEGGIHVPYFMRWPSQIEAGMRVGEPVHHFDIYATAADAAGAALPADRVMDGRSLLPVLRSEAMTGPLHDQLVWRGGDYDVILAGGWKLQRDARQERIWLFNLAEDPTEQTDLSEARPDIVADLSARLDAHNAEQAEPAWRALVDVPVRIDATEAEPWEADDEYVYSSN